MVIRTEALTKTYGSVRALRGVDLEVEGGGIVGILGPNGAGKTTLVEILEGLRPPTSGRARVLGLDPARERTALKQRIGVQLQSTTIPPDLTSYEVLRLYASFYRRALPVGDVLERMGLGDKERERVRNLSGGQQQRLALGMALIHDPELLIFDEPTTGLDPAARRRLHRIIQELKERGSTVLLTTHYIEEAEKLCERVLIIRDGEIVADGTPFDLVGRAGGKSILWIDVDGEIDTAPLLDAGAEPQGRQGEHLRFAAAEPAAVIVALGRLLEAQEVSLTDLRLHRPTLEDVYLELVGDPDEGIGPVGAAGPGAAAVSPP